MKTSQLIDTLKRFSENDPDIETVIFLSVSKSGVLANRNFCFVNAMGNILLVSPESLANIEHIINTEKGRFIEYDFSKYTKEEKELLKHSLERMIYELEKTM